MQMYLTTVMRVFCDCEAGLKEMQKIKNSLIEQGVDPESQSFQWFKRSDILNIKKRKNNC